MAPSRKEPQFGYTPEPEDNDRRAAPRGRYVESARRRSWFPAIAVMLALIAFGWLIWKSYRHHHITTASGQPPVITADPAPVKVKPEPQSGMNTPYRDTTVYDELAQGKQKSQTLQVEHLLQPAEEPMPKPIAATAPAPAAVQPQPTPPPISTHEESGLLPPPPVAAVPAPAAPLLPAPVATPKEMPDAAQDSPTALAPQLDTQAVPVQPPSSDQTDMMPPPPPEKPAPPPMQALATTALAPATAATFAVQLGAFKDVATANGQWQKLQASYPAQLGSLSSKVDTVDVQGKGILYRLKGVGVGQAQAKTICDALKAQNITCLVAPK